MEEYNDNLYSIFETLNNLDTSKGFINNKLLSKQYLAYYIYRVITKNYDMFIAAVSNKDMSDFYKYLRIPEMHDKDLPYPLVGKMQNDEEILDLIILAGIDIMNKTQKFIEQNETFKESYPAFFRFIEDKTLEKIIADLIDLYKLLPNLSIPSIRPNVINNRN